MNCPVCNSTACHKLNKKVRGCDQAGVSCCNYCQHHWLTDCSLEKDYYKKEYDTFLAERSKDQSWTLPEEHAQKRVVEAHERLDWLSEYLDFSSADTILELGCSSGFMLQALKERLPDKEIWGVEPSDKHRNRANNAGLNVCAANHELGNRKFDIIFAFFVLEHISDPLTWLKEINDYGNTGGKILMVVPNGREALVSTYPESNYDQFVWQAPHLSYFSPVSLKTVLRNFDNQAKVHHYQRYSLSNHLNWLSGIKPKMEEDYDHITSDVDYHYKKSLLDNEISDTLIGVIEVS